MHTLAGFSATLALGGGYLLCGRRNGLSGVLAGTAGGLVAWAIAGLLLTRFDLSRLGGTLITLAAILVFMRLYRHVPETAATPRGGFSWPALALRAGLAAGIIFLITGLAHVVPSAWAGVMAAFPVTMYPFLVILHLTHGAAPVATVIKHYRWPRVVAVLRPLRLADLCPAGARLGHPDRFRCGHALVADLDPVPGSVAPSTRCRDLTERLLDTML